MTLTGPKAKPPPWRHRDTHGWWWPVFQPLVVRRVSYPRSLQLARQLLLFWLRVTLPPEGKGNTSKPLIPEETLQWNLQVMQNIGSGNTCATPYLTLQPLSEHNVAMMPQFQKWYSRTPSVSGSSRRRKRGCQLYSSRSALPDHTHSTPPPLTAAQGFIAFSNPGN